MASKWLPEVVTLRIAYTEEKNSRDSQHVLFHQKCRLKMAVTSISDEIVCVGYPASSCFSVLAVLNVTTHGSHLPAMLGKYPIR